MLGIDEILRILTPVQERYNNFNKAGLPILNLERFFIKMKFCPANMISHSTAQRTLEFECTKGCAAACSNALYFSIIKCNTG